MASISLVAFLVLALVNVAFGDLHRLFVGNLAAPSSIHLIVFDDDALTLNKTATIKASDPHSWITFDQNKQNIYGVSLNKPRVASYSVHLNQNANRNTSLRLDSVVNYNGNCFNKTSAFIIQSPKSPNAVYTSQWPGPAACGSSFKILGNGTLSSVSETWKYSNNSGVHGLAFGPEGDRLYSADLSGDGIWTHSVGNDGKVAAIGTLAVPNTGLHPRHIAAHSAGQRVYVVLEAGNAVVEYLLNEDTQAVQTLVNSWTLIPTGANTTKYWSAEVMLSSTERFLWATARPEAKTNLTGWISLFELNGDGNIQRKLFSVPTTAVNTNAVAISPSPFDDQWAALADQGYVQIWQVKNGTGRYVNTTATPVATFNIADGGCCANAIWYD